MVRNKRKGSRSEFPSNLGQPLEQLGMASRVALGATAMEQLAERLAELEQFLAELVTCSACAGDQAAAWSE